MSAEELTQLSTAIEPLQLPTAVHSAVLQAAEQGLLAGEAPALTSKLQKLVRNVEGSSSKRDGGGGSSGLQSWLEQVAQALGVEPPAASAAAISVPAVGTLSAAQVSARLQELVTLLGLSDLAKVRLDQHMHIVRHSPRSQTW